MSTDLTPERKLCDWIDANGIVMQGATPSMLLSAAGLDALTARAEAAERDLAAVTVSRDGWQTRAEAAEKKVAKVRELHAASPCEPDCCLLDTCNECLNTHPCPTITALDGAHTKQLGGTPTGEFADVCSCGKSYWPCDSLDGGA